MWAIGSGSDYGYYPILRLFRIIPDRYPTKR